VYLGDSLGSEGERSARIKLRPVRDDVAEICIQKILSVTFQPA
jgi:hypothetical protein